jgi:hypothetical protein
MIKRKLKRNAISPEDYQAGFNVAQKEFEFFVQLKNRLQSIRATQQLKNGQLFLEAIEVYHEDMREDY